MRSRFGELSLDVNGEVAGALPALNVRGDVYVRAGRIEVDRVLEQFSESAYATESTPIDDRQPRRSRRDRTVHAGDDPDRRPARDSPSRQAPSLFDAVTLDAHLRVPNNLVLRGDDVKAAAGGYSVGNLNLTVGGDIHATKAAGDRPVVVGSIRTVRGFYEFQGRRFDLERDGTVSFKGPDPTDPTLDITGIRDISGVAGAGARPRHRQASGARHQQRSAAGRSRRPLADRVQPPRERAGRRRETAIAQTAATMVGGLVTAPLAEALRDALDVDLLEISAGGDSGAGPSVAIGNQLGERVFVRVRQQFGSADVTQFLLDYELTEQLRLQTSASDGGQTNRTPGQRVEQAGIDFVFVKNTTDSAAMALRVAIRSTRLPSPIDSTTTLTWTCPSRSMRSSRGGGLRQVDDRALAIVLPVRTAIDDPHVHRTAVLQIGDAHARAEGQRAMGGDQLSLIEDLSAGAFAAVEEIGQIGGVAAQHRAVHRSRNAAQAAVRRAASAMPVASTAATPQWTRLS